MDRLKGREGEGNSDGELVTRSDGSQAMKVRKRRRRSNQAVDKETKRNHRVQIMQIAGFVILIVAVVLVAGVGLIYANSTAFREGLSAKLEAASGAKVKLYQFRMNPAAAASNRADLDWPGGNALSSLRATGVVAKIAPVSFLSRSFKGEEIVAQKGELILRSPVAGQPAIARDAAGVPPVSFSRYSVPVLDLFFGEEKNRLNMLEKTEASFFPSDNATQGELRLNGGLLNIQGWPPLTLDRSYVKFTQAGADVKSMRFFVPAGSDRKDADPGFINFSGTIQPLDANATHSMAVELDSFRLSYLLGADLGRFFLGRLETRETPDSNFLLVTPSAPETSKLEITATNALDSRIDVSGFKFLSTLSNFLIDRSYELPNFDDEVTLVVTREGESVKIKEFILEKRGQMAMRGNMRNGEAGQIRGNIRVGVPEGMILSSKSKTLDTMFGEVREGYRWIDLEISGTGASPADNFLDLFEAARSKQQFKEADSAEPDSFQDLVDPE